jgi:phenylacetic acid degradation operon negative regulatory protein
VTAIAARDRSDGNAVNWRARTDTLLKHIAPRGKSLIMTVYGDAILPHGGGAWLGDLIGLLAPLGLNERVVRTSVYRLVQDDLLAARQAGRRSFYALTPTGARQTSTASRRVYALRPEGWDGAWTQVWLPEKDTDTDTARDTLARELARLGFAPLAPDVMIHVGGALALAEQTLERLGLSTRAVVLSSRMEGPVGEFAAMRGTVARIWPLDTLVSEYMAFLEIAEPVLATLESDGRPDGAASFVLQSLLIHAYRRIVLKDPMLPLDLMPPEWPGPRATKIMRDLYVTLAPAAREHVAGALGMDVDGFGGANAQFAARFCL